MTDRHAGARSRAIASIVVGALFLACGVLTSLAAPPRSSEKGLQQLTDDRQKIVRKTLQLDAAQQAAFDPIFAEYEVERIALGKERNGIADDFSSSALAMSTADASALIDRTLRLRRERVELDERYRPRFEAVVPPQKVLLLFQLNFILDAVVSYKLAGAVPLVH